MLNEAVETIIFFVGLMFFVGVVFGLEIILSLIIEILTKILMFVFGSKKIKAHKNKKISF